MRLSNQAYVFIYAVCALFSVASTRAQDFGAAASPENTVNCAAPNYGCARSDLIKTNNLNPPPSVGTGKNALVTPSDFKLPVVRVTDGNTFGKETFTTTPSGSNGDNVFNTNDTYLLVVDNNGSRYPVSFNPSTMQVLNATPWNIGTNQVRWSGSSSFSRVNPNTMWAVPKRSSIAGVHGNGTTLFNLTLSGTTSISATGKKVFDFATCPGMANPYDIGHGIWRSPITVSSGDKRFAQGFSNQKGGQDTGTDVVVYDAPSGQCYRYDTKNAKLCTSTGCVPMSLPDEFKIHGVYMSLDGKYVRIAMSKCIKGGCTQGTSHPYFWEVGTTNVTRCYTSSHTANCSGHMVEGFSHIYNSTTWPQTGKRTFTDPLSFSVVNTTPDLTPGTDNHYSNNAADPNDSYPFWMTNVQNVRTEFGGAGCNKSGNLYLGCTFPGPLYGEVFGITQGGNYIRAAHTYNSGSSTYFNCSNTIGAVSQTGNFFVWSSDWLTTLGKDDKGHYRCDTFVVHLSAQQGATH